MGLSIMSKENKKLLEEKRDHIVMLILNRPEQANSLDRELVNSLKNTFEKMKWDGSVKVIILKGSGDKSFCAGIDLKERSHMDDNELLLYRERELQPFMQSMAAFPKPIIGAINGAALGGGAELALMCDIRIAASKAHFGQTEIRWGLIPSGGACQRLRVIAGLTVAKELAFTGRIIEAEEAFRVGIYNKVVSPEDLTSEVMDLGNSIAQHSSLAIKQAKEVIDFGAGISALSVFDFEASKECFYRGQAIKGPRGFKSR